MNTDTLVNVIVSLFVGLIVWWGGFRFFRGTGKKLRLFVSVLVAGMALIFPDIGRIVGFIGLFGVLALEVWYNKNKKDFSYSQLTYEGGGIRRGLLPVEVGALYSLEPSTLFVLGLVEIFQKGFVAGTNVRGGGLIVGLDKDFQTSREILSPKLRRENRQEAAYQKKMLLTPSEDVLLEIFGQNNGKSLGEYSIQPWIDVLNRSVITKLSGYDKVETQGYYKEFIAHRLKGIVAGYFNPQDYIGWMILSRHLGDKNDQIALQLLKKTRPSWLQEGENFLDWLNLVSSVSW